MATIVEGQVRAEGGSNPSVPVFGVFEPTVDAGPSKTEAVSGDAQVRARASGGVCGQVVVESEGDPSAAGVRGNLEY
ncbi:hypothetical protein [Streptomyces sioyaensis]|uniref:hypothetical protein n=1 Tax=Streptomyces sioyaensis TaxID=67364 RepID=UPI003721E58D